MKTDSELLPEDLVLLVLGIVPAWSSGYTYLGTEAFEFLTLNGFWFSQISDENLEMLGWEGFKIVVK